MMKKDLVDNVNKLISIADELLKKKITYNVRRELSELYLSFSLLHDNFNIDSISKVSLEYLMNKIANEICYESFFNFYMGFYYLPKKVYHKQADELSTAIFQDNVNISCFRCQIHASGMLKFSLDTSTNNYFFSRGNKIAEAIRNFIAYPFEFDVSSIVYLALNYYQTLCEYEQCADNTYERYLQSLKSEFENIFKIILKNEDVFATLQDNQQLLGFWCSTVPSDFNLNFEFNSLPDTVNTRYRWILFSYYRINEDKANELFEKQYEKIISLRTQKVIDISLVVRLLCHTLLYKNDIDISEYELINTQADNSKGVQHPLNFFFKYYNNSYQQNCTNQDLETLISLNDGELRQKVAACMQNVDKNELERQITKPHGTLEISDLDIRFFEDGELKYLCMPFKTGREITASTMGESYMYQLIKPFSHFGNQCFVVLITAKKCSQGLETFIQRMSIKIPSWRIEVIQYEQLCKLLKANGQL